MGTGGAAESGFQIGHGIVQGGYQIHTVTEDGLKIIAAITLPCGIEDRGVHQQVALRADGSGGDHGFRLRRFGGGGRHGCFRGHFRGGFLRICGHHHGLIRRGRIFRLQVYHIDAQPYQ